MSLPAACANTFALAAFVYICACEIDDPTKPGHELMLGGAKLGEIRCCSLAQAVRRAPRRQLRLAASISKPVADARRGERVTLTGDQKRQVVARRHRLDCGLQAQRGSDISKESLAVFIELHARGYNIARESGAVTITISGKGTSYVRSNDDVKRLGGILLRTPRNT